MMDIDLVLAPVDGSEQSERAAEYAVAVARRYDADLHLLFVIDERLGRDIDAGRVEPESIAKKHRAFTARVRELFGEEDREQTLKTSSATAFSEGRLMQMPGSVVLDVAEGIEADFVVIPRERDENAIGRAAQYVLQYASQPVLSI